MACQQGKKTWKTYQINPTTLLNGKIFGNNFKTRLGVISTGNLLWLMSSCLYSWRITWLMVVPVQGVSTCEKTHGRTYTCRCIKLWFGVWNILDLDSTRTWNLWTFSSNRHQKLAGMNIYLWFSHVKRIKRLLLGVGGTFPAVNGLASIEGIVPRTVARVIGSRNHSGSVK